MQNFHLTLQITDKTTVVTKTALLFWRRENTKNSFWNIYIINKSVVFLILLEKASILLAVQKRWKKWQ